jgi:hypothetical protein
MSLANAPGTEEMPMRRIVFATISLLAAAFPAFPPPAVAQEKVLHIGLREDPDLLDPTLACATSCSTSTAS